MEVARGRADTQRVPGGDVVLAVEHDGQRLIVPQTAIGNRLAAKLLDMDERKCSKVDIRSSGGQNVLRADAERELLARSDRTLDRNTKVTSRKRNPDSAVIMAGRNH